MRSPRGRERPFRRAGALVHVVARGLPSSRARTIAFRSPGARRFERCGCRRAGVWAIAALALLLFAWTGSVTLYLAFHDDVIGAILARQAEMKAGYEDRLADARARLDEAASRQLLERNSFKGAVNAIMSRQSRLEQRGAIVAALAETEARNPSSTARRQATTPSPADALGAIQALAPPMPAGESVDDAARAYAPPPEPRFESRAVKPHPIDEFGDTLSALPSGAPFTTASVAGSADNLDSSARLAAVDRSLNQVEGAQTKALAAVDRVAQRSASRDAAIVAETGLDPAKLSVPREQGGVGGPFIPVDPNTLPLDSTLARVARDVATAERLKALMSFVPLRMPLAGDPSVTSPFGYRVDPFLGRLALHPGVDLAEAEGAEIHAAAAGRVVHSGPAGGYGNHGRDRSRQWPRNALRAHVGSAGRGRPASRQGRRLGQARFDRPLDRAAFAL